MWHSVTGNLSSDPDSAMKPIGNWASQSPRLTYLTGIVLEKVAVLVSAGILGRNKRKIENKEEYCGMFIKM